MPHERLPSLHSWRKTHHYIFGLQSSDMTVQVRHGHATKMLRQLGNGRLGHKHKGTTIAQSGILRQHGPCCILLDDHLHVIDNLGRGRNKGGVIRNRIGQDLLCIQAAANG
jgi:hypothetical protein